MYERFNVKISGDVLLMHNGQLCDPLNEYAKEVKAISNRKNKTESDHKMLADAEFIGGLYVSGNKPVLPTRVLEATICEGARKTRHGRIALSSLFVDTDGVLTYDGGPLTVKQLVKSDEHRLTVGVKVQRARIMRTRPMFRNWSAEFKLSILSALADAEQAHTWLNNAGAMVGVGDYRPRYGRFTVVNFDRI